MKTPRRGSRNVRSKAARQHKRAKRQRDELIAMRQELETQRTPSTRSKGHG